MAPDYSDWKNFKKPVKENVVKNQMVKQLLMVVDMKKQMKSLIKMYI